ncbi:alpha/beta hydrolase [Hymenobacter latericus]|uniref:alpha/beta hydrolase n=1 Tax=Hymenobacter sp. YIM 151858-1 TaxID=2987688 RepID=UPI00222644E9|nr:alpha/beta hydrolase [Hymenobacter sp. YIM 151858-1]UYZ57777.1 alpha/beta hydrolase [Hymenobacter sp. YIM 151858-1]
MKQLLLIWVTLLLSCCPAFAQIDTTGGRYWQPRFQQVTVTRGVEYGAAPNLSGTTQTLRLDLYEPTNDTVRRRPLIVFAHEGAFLTGNRDDAFMAAICTRLAQLGYVAASIDYRTGFFPLDSLNVGQAALRATQDMRAAIRFFRRDAATVRQYRVHPGYIFAAGSSAGGFMALQVGYLDKPAEVPSYINLNQLGGLEGNSGNPGYSSRVAGVVNLCGALGSLSWLEPGNVPLCSVHGTADGVVPYGVGKAWNYAASPRLFGSGAIKPRADALGIPNVLRTLRNAPHVPYNGSSPSSVAYFDTTYQTVRAFLRPLLRQPGTVLSAARSNILAGELQIYPVPAQQLIVLEATGQQPFRPRQVELIDARGRVVRRFMWDKPRMLIPRGNLPEGTYYLSGEGLQGLTIILQ